MPQLSIAILGLGDIGRTVAKACKALNMTVWGVVRSEKREKESFVDHYMTVSQLSEALRSCDYVCNVLPSTPATKHLLSGSILESGKDKKPVFINIGRGDVISESSLVNALNRGWLSGAILDVFEVEPLPKESELWRMSQVVITPHIAALTFSSEVSRCLVVCAHCTNIVDILLFVTQSSRNVWVVVCICLTSFEQIKIRKKSCDFSSLHSVAFSLFSEGLNMYCCNFPC